MSKRWLNAVVGYSAGSLSYFLFLVGAFVFQASGLKLLFESSPQFRPTLCFAPRMPFWYAIVQGAELNHRHQPHYLYLAALLGALILLGLQRPWQADQEHSRRRMAATMLSFGAFLILNLWFSASNSSLRHPF